MIAFGLLLAGVIAVAIWIWRRSCSIDCRIASVRKDLRALSGRRLRPNRVETFLSKVYLLLQECIDRRNTSALYQTVDILKSAYGSGVFRQEEAAHAVSLAIKCIRDRQYDAASVITDALRPLVRRQTPVSALALLNQLQLMSIVSLREKQSFLASKAVDLVFQVLAKSDLGKDPSVAAKALEMLKVTGSLAIRRRDADLLREIAARLLSWQGITPELENGLVELIAAWLYRVAPNEDLTLYDIIHKFIGTIARMRVLRADSIKRLFQEFKDAAGASCLNPFSRIAPLFTSSMIELGCSSERVADLKSALKAAGEVVRLAVYNHGLKTAFPVLVPLLEKARRLLVLELKFGGMASEGSLRQQTLFLAIQECLSILEFASRQRMTDTVGDLITEMVEYWPTDPDRAVNLKSFKKLCGLLLLYWGATRRRKSREAAHSQTGLALFSAREQECLGFILGGIRFELLSGIGSEV
ncbi:MAG: hypothetical protein N2491_07755 [Negativicutes bacterium]|nr:hypothetical protein [Negativicutes bacterium]